MKNFTNNFKQFTSRLSARWLIMALMMLVGTGSAWGWTIYYDNSGTPSWTDVYVVIGHGTWWRSYQMTKNNNVFQYTDTGWDDATFIAFSNSHKNSNGGNNTDWNSISNIRFGYGVSHVDKHVFTTNSSKLVDITHVSDVLNGNVIGFYVGEYTSWNQQQFYVKNSSITIPTCLSFESGNERYGVVYASSFDYTISHGDGTWNGPTLGEKAVLGTAYLVKNNNEVSKNAGTLPSCTFSIDNTIKAGETSTKSVTSSGKSKYGTQDYSEDSYYVKKSGETSLTKLEVEGSELQTQSLAVGEYTIYVLLFDGRIYAKGGEQTLTVETACEKPDAPDFGTNGVEVCEGTQVTLPTIAGVTLKWYDENNQEATETFNATENKTYYAVVVGDCESDKTPYTITIKTKPTVTLNPTENTVCSGVALDGITRYVEIESTEGSQISWYAAAQGGDALAPSIALDATSYFAEATLNGCSSDRAKFTITEVLSAPTEVPNVTAPATICAGESAVLKLNNKNANYTYKVNGDVVAFTNDEYTVLPTITTDYIVSVENKCGSLSTTKTITVNPLPTITSISASNDKPVPFEDVVLTADGVTSGAEVKWYLGNDVTPVSTGTTYVVTSEDAGEVIVKAKAFLNGCESAVATKTVIFDEEDCTPNISNDIQITFYHPSTYNDYNSQKGQWWGMGTMYYSTDKKSWKTIDMGEATSGLKTVTIQNITSEKLYVYFESKWTYHVSNKASTIDDIEELTKGNSYDIRITRHGSDNVKATSEATCTGSLSTQPPLSSPAVKTVSVNSEQGSGVVNFVGKVIKTGCAAGTDIWVGYQYKKKDDVWPTTGITAGTGEKQLIPIGNNLVDFSKNIEGLADGDYHFRAYIINGYNFTNGNYDQGVYYGLEKLVTVSTTKTPISEVAIKYSDIDGNDDVDDPNPMCKGAIAYVKLSYTGSRYSDIKWLVEGVETNLVTDEGDGVWSYEIQGDGCLSVELKNDANTDPAWPSSNKLPFTIIPEPTAPYISINPASDIICQGTPATIKVENPSTDCSYKLVEEGSKAGFEPYKSGDLKYTVQNVGKYYVVAQHNACTDNEYTSNQVAINQIISTNANISIDPAKAETTPWEPVTITVKPDAGYIYELSYTDGNLAAVDGVRIKQNGDSYTYYIPRPDAWTTGDSNPVRTPINYGIKAQLKVDGEASQCDLNAATATIQLKDEDNEDCPK